MNKDKFKYLDWRKESQKIIVPVDDWNDLVYSLDASKQRTDVWQKKTIRSYWRDWQWYLTNNQSGKPCIYTGGVNENGFQEYIIYTAGTSGIDDESFGGFECKRELNSILINRTGKGLEARFGYIGANKHKRFNNSDFSEYELIVALHNINRCNGPLIGTEYGTDNTYYDSGIYKADVKSAYPFAALYEIPDIRTGEIVKGYVAPTEEWPVVYYLKSYHIAEFNKYDTHSDKYSPLWRFRNKDKKPHYTQFKKEPYIEFRRVPDEEEVCLRCKYSIYNLKEFEQIYLDKERAEGTNKAQKKALLNNTIGTFDYVLMEDDLKTISENTYSYIGHVRAVILARHNHKMIEYYNEIVKKGYEFICIQTDSMIWRGGPLDCVVKTQKIGDFHEEITNGRLFLHGCGAYFIEDENSYIEKHQGIKDFPAIDNLEDFREFFKPGRRIKKLIYDHEKKLFIEGEVIL